MTLHLSADADRPVGILALGSVGLTGRAGVPLVEVFTSAEQRSRTSQAYVRSSVGERLRTVATTSHRTTNSEVTRVIQQDPLTGLIVNTTLTCPDGAAVVRVEHTLENSSDEPITLTAVTSLTVGFSQSEDELDQLMLHTAASEWLAENRWSSTPLRDVLPQLDLEFHGQEGRGHAALTSHGSWSTGEHLTVGAISNPLTDESLAWQIETSGAWHVDLSQSRDGGVLSVLGPTDLEHQFAHELLPGASFSTVPVALAVSTGGRDGAFGELTRYRRWLRGDVDADLPIVYNDFMNTLMGDPSTEKLLPLVEAAADAGAEVFCIDAGWFGLGDWWSSVGEWREAPGRFSSGLAAVIDRIHDLGMRSGLWLEPEVVGVDSPVARSLPEAAFFHRFGQRVREHDRFHLDFRHPAARQHLDETIDHLVADYGITYLKLDYNINPGAGTEDDATRSGDGLLGHTRAFRDWLRTTGERHPGVLLENCSSGAMRADYSLLSVTHLQSTSDQQDFLLYPPIAASAPASILPEQCGNWAYPAATMSDEETAFTLVTGLAGRLYLSGFISDLNAAQTELVRQAVTVHKRTRGLLSEAIPFWPLGLPAWDDDIVCVGLRSASSTLVAIWDRSDAPHEVILDGVTGTVVDVFPAALTPWPVTREAGQLRVSTGRGTGARFFVIEEVGA